MFDAALPRDRQGLDRQTCGSERAWASAGPGLLQGIAPNPGDDLIRAVEALNRAVSRATTSGWEVTIEAREFGVTAKVSRSV